MAARECYIAMLEMDNHLQKMNIEEHWMVAEPVEGLEEIPFDNSKPDRTTKIDTLASSSIYRAFTTFLKENQDVFA